MWRRWTKNTKMNNELETYYYANYAYGNDWERIAFRATQGEMWSVPVERDRTGKFLGFTRENAEKLIYHWNRTCGKDQYKLKDIYKNMNKDKIQRINTAIDNLPGVCADGKKGIRKLLGEVLDVDLQPIEKIYHIGQQVQINNSSSPYIICLAYLTDIRHVQAVHLKTGHVFSSAKLVTNIDRITEEEMFGICEGLPFKVISE
jgi:hypothetical protein